MSSSVNSSQQLKRKNKKSGLSCFSKAGNTEESENPINVENGKANDAQEDTNYQDYTVLPRKVVIEPALVLASLFGGFWEVLCVQYHLYAIGEKYNLTAILNAEYALGGNTTLSGDDDSLCSSSLDTKNTTGYHIQQQAQAEATMFDLRVSIIANVPGFIMLLFFGSLIDNVGKRPVLLMTVVGMMLQASIYILQQLASLPLEVVYISGILEAFVGCFPTFIVAADAYLISSVPLINRAKRLTLADLLSVGCMSLAGYVLGLAIQHLGFIWAFVITLIGHCVNLCYIVFFVPETRKGKPKWKSVSIMYILKSVKVLFKKRPTRKALLVSIMPWMLSELTFRGGFRFYAAFKLNSPFCWTSSMLGAYDAIGAGIGSATQLFAGVFLLTWIDPTYIIVLSQCCWILYNVTSAVAKVDWVLWFALIFQTFWAMAIPLYKSVSSTLVTPAEHGALFATLVAFQEITAVVGLSIFSNVYASTLYFFKGTVFIVMSLFLAIGVCFTIWFIIIQKKRAKEAEASKEDNDKDMDKDNEEQGLASAT